ncbi:MAG: hypothetical protein PHD81_02650 [Candidatus Nanoarchaeia archaeon]|nr:hypothetical protein [Candidatus Nanoarchaeia archaeon]
MKFYYPMSKKTKSKKKKVSPKKEKPISIYDKEFKTLLTNLIGPEAVTVVDQLIKRKNVSEFTVAENLEMNINQFRSIIYKLDAYNLVSGTRKKDKKKGWYIYYWTFHPERLENLYWNIKLRKLKKLKERLAQESKTLFYVCPNKCIRVNLHEGMEMNFRCPECNSLLKEDIPNIKKFEKEIKELEEELKKAGKLQY